MATGKADPSSASEFKIEVRLGERVKPNGKSQSSTHAAGRNTLGALS